MLHNCCKNGRWMWCTLTCSTVVFVACLGTNMHQFSIRLPNTPNAMNNILFYCCLCVTSWYTYDHALLRISLAFSYPCVETSWMLILELNRERMPKRYVIASGIGGVMNWESRTIPLLNGPSLVMHTVDSLHHFTSAHIVYVYYNISDIAFIPQMLWAFWRC